MAERIRTCAKRERPNVPITLRLDLNNADIVSRMAEETGKPVSVVLEKLVLYALTRVQVKTVERKELCFPEDGGQGAGVREQGDGQGAGE